MVSWTFSHSNSCSQGLPGYVYHSACGAQSGGCILIYTGYSVLFPWTATSFCSFTSLSFLPPTTKTIQAYYSIPSGEKRGDPPVHKRGIRRTEEDYGADSTQAVTLVLFSKRHLSEEKRQGREPARSRAWEIPGRLHTNTRSKEGVTRCYNIHVPSKSFAILEKKKKKRNPPPRESFTSWKHMPDRCPPWQMTSPFY